jgi:hypothetical protein
VESWTSAVQTATVAALTSRLDLGLPLALSDINTVLLAQAGADLTATTGASRSTGTVAGVLACLAGRTYRIHQTDSLGVSGGVGITSTDKYIYQSASNDWTPTSTSLRGGFTQPVMENGGAMIGGEITSTATYGDVVFREVGGIRHSYNVDSVTTSAIVGALKHMTNPMTLWPVLPAHALSPYALSQPKATTYASRLVTVYNDDGSVLA